MCLILTVLVSLLLATNSAIPQGLFSGTLVPLIHPTPCHKHQCSSEQCDVMWRVSEWWVLEEAACEFLYHCVNTIWLFSSVVMDTSDVCCSEEPPPCAEDVGGTWGRCVSQNTSESHSSVCTHNLIQHSTHDTNHVHRFHPLSFTELPMVDPLSVWSTCCPSLERECLRWMIMVGHVFTVQLSVVASQWWGTSWTRVDLTSV